MDVEALDPLATQQILRALERINAWLGGVRATLGHLNHYSKQWSGGSTIRFLDWGTGGADIPRAIVQWCRAKGFKSEVVGVDMNGSVLNYAREASRLYPEIKLVQADFSQLPDLGGSFDYALSSLCLHHLTNAQIVDLLKLSDRLVKRGIIMNDLQRSAGAWLGIWLLSRAGRAHPIVQHDGPLSVRRAFTKNELQDLARQAGLPYLRAQTHFAYRFTLAGEKGESLDENK
jgi:SAM-dependent methyltransferase